MLKTWYDMKILLTNDDGVDAKGISFLKDILVSLGHSVMVIAPDRNCSASSHSLTLRTAIIFKQIRENVIAVQGTPVDCVYLALNGLLEYVPDLVISGINEGENLGDDVIYSGTLAAAREARLAGVSAIAVSLAGEKNFMTASLVVEKLLREKIYLDYNLWNINVPDVEYENIQGVKLTKQGFRNIKARDRINVYSLRNESAFWVNKPSRPDEKYLSLDYDFGAVARNFVSITPVSIDYTLKDFSHLNNMSCLCV